jgi:molybdopterin-binding protein
MTSDQGSNSDQSVIFMKELLKPIDAARLAGVSYPTLKQWIYKGKITTTRTAGGHHRIARSEIDRVTGASTARKKKTRPVGLDAISGRNKLLGTILELRYEGLLVQVTIDVAGQQITSIITSDAARALELKEGVPVYALIKATEVMVIRG